MIQFISDPAQLLELEQPWRCLGGNHPFRGLTWHRSWWEHAGRDAQLLVAIDRDDDGSLRFVAPLFWKPSAMQSRIRFLASGNACTDYQAMLVRSGEEADRMAELAAALDRFMRPAARWSSCQIELDGVDPGDAWYGAFCEALRRRDYCLREERIECTYVASLPEQWDMFVSGLHKSFRRKVNKHHRRLNAGEFTLHRTETAAQIPAALAVLRTLHQRRRAMLGQPGSFADATFEPFLRSAVTQLFEQGQAEIQWVQVGDSTVASQLVFLHDDTVSMYVSGVDPAAMDQEPGHMIVTASIADAIARGYRKFDFLRGDEHYKRLWSGEPTQLVRCHLTPPAAVSRIAEQATVWAKKVKTHVKQSVAGAGQ